MLSSAAKRSINRHVSQNSPDTLIDLQRVFKGCGTNGTTPSRPTFTAAIVGKRIGQHIARKKGTQTAEKEALTPSVI